MDDKNKKEEEEESESENLRELILQQLANLEQSDVSDDDSYKVRLSCILEDDESESSGAAQKECSKEVEKRIKRNKESDKIPPDFEVANVRLSGGSACDSELSDDFACENVQITDLDYVTMNDPIEEKIEEQEVVGKVDEENNEDVNRKNGFAIKKLKSSDNVHSRPFIIRRRELSSDSSDLDTSLTNSGEGPSKDFKIEEICESTQNSALDVVNIESETSADEDLDQTLKEPLEIEILDNETLSSIFAKVSKTYLEKMKSHVKWEENEKVDERLFVEATQDRARSRERDLSGVTGEHLSFQDVHIRGTSPKEYNPPVPPETYLWEELKRLRERGGYPWTYLDKPPFDEATWKKYMGRSSESLENSVKEERLREKSLPLTIDKSPSLPRDRKKVSRESSTSSIGREVRCACQFYQSDNPLPERISLFGSRPPSRNSDMAQTTGEHVYEPINPPPLTLEKKPGLIQEISSQSPPFQGSSIPETDKQIVRSPSKKELSKKSKESIEDSKTSEDLEVEQISSGYKLEEELEKNFTKDSSPGPSAATSPTTPSFSRTDVTTSVLDSSGFEDQTVKQDTLVKRKKEQVKAQAHELQEKLKTQAGKIKSKITNIQKPTLRKSRDGTSAEKQKFRFPEMHAPKLNFPEMHAPKLHFPDTSKFRLSEKAKFHFPESGKFQIPHKPKFSLPERPKLNLRERAKIRLPERAKFHLPNKAQFHLPDRSKFHLPKTKFHLPERAKLDRLKSGIPKFNKSQEGQTPPDSSKGKFDFISYPKLFSKHSKDYVTSSPKPKRILTSSTNMNEMEIPTKKDPEKWVQKLDDLQYADDDMDEDIKDTGSHRSESIFDYREKELGYTEDFGKAPHEVRTLSTKSSTSQISDRDMEFENWQKNGRKKGVLEEINADEYFLRQKGISQDDIDMGKYLSQEIREAFRSPGVNALAKMDYIGDENIDVMRNYPQKPTRKTSVKKKSILKKTSQSDSFIPDDGYKTYPPRRPARKSRSQSKSLVNEEAAITDQMEDYDPSEINRSIYDDDEVNLSRYDNISYNDDNITEYYKSPGPPREYEYYKVPKPLSPSSSLKRKSSLGNDSMNERIHESWDDTDLMVEPPKPMERKKSKKKKKEMEKSTSEKLLSQEFSEQLEEFLPQPQLLDSPVPPKRTRSRSSGFRSLRSLQADDEVSRSFESESSKQKLMEDIVVEERKFIEEIPFTANVSEFMTGRHHDYEVTDLDDVGFGYATVGKTSASKPEKQKKPERPPPPKRKKGASTPSYNTYPKKTPIRPLRNYSSLGPTRPPRHKKITPIERQFKTYSEIQIKSFDEPSEITKVSGSAKDLQTEKIIEKMKGRPLPPPPRPPRQRGKGLEDNEPTEEELISLSILKDDEFPLIKKIATSYQESPPENKLIIDEICTATQTDPLPEEFSYEGEEEAEMMQEFSHEQLRIQQSFLNEMKREEELQESGNIADVELKPEVIKQIQDLIEEEEKALRRQQEKPENFKQLPPTSVDIPQTSAKSHLAVDDTDMGYASLDRKGHKQETQKQEIQQQIPLKLEKLQLKELEVETINVREIQSEQIFVKELQSNRIASQEIDNTGGNISLGNIDFPPTFIDQIVAKIPWDSLRQSQEQSKFQEEQKTLSPVRPQRRQRLTQYFDDSDDEDQYQPRRSHRRHHKPQHSSDEESSRRERKQIPPAADFSGSIPELSLQLARACTYAGAQALRTFVRTNTDFARSLDREMCVQAVLCIAVALVAGFFLFGFDAKIVHLNKWDFMFPPQEPPETGA